MAAQRRIAALFPLVLAFLPIGASAQDWQGWHPSVAEATLLPKYCWGKFLGEKFKGPEFTIHDCGVGMNHYCPGLVALSRANRSVDDRTRQGYLFGAKAQVQYTVKALEKYPRCPIRGDVMRTHQLIERELSVLR